MIDVAAWFLRRLRGISARCQRLYADAALATILRWRRRSITLADADRAAAARAFHAEQARRFWPQLTSQDLDCLADSEIDMTPRPLNPCLADLPRWPTQPFARRHDGPETWTRNPYLDSTNNPLVIDPCLAPPRLLLDAADGCRPLLKVAPVHEPRGLMASYAFEFDTKSTFDSPNFWRYPPLMPYVEGTNLPDRRGLSFFALTTTLRSREIGRQPYVRFPFNPASMCLPHDSERIGFEDLQRVALTLGHGLSRMDLIKAIYRYVQLAITWANDTVFRPPLDVLRGGLGGCGHVNALVGLLLELNGVRCRGVAGFDPLLRTIYPGAGHAAIEFVNPGTGRWEYLDAFLDLWLEGRAACDLPADPQARSLRIMNIDSDYDHDRYGRTINLARIFKYRIYFDVAGRLPMTSMLHLTGKESRYGARWPLLTPAVRPDVIRTLITSTRTIYVRARYVLSGSPMSIAHVDPQHPAAVVASPWSTGSFVARGTNA
jgi:hypothetical protein